MNKQGKTALAIGAGILIVLFLLFLLRRGGAGAAGSVSYDLPAVYGPGAGPMYHSDPVNITIPGLDLGGPNLSMIGACCSDCMQSNSQFYQPQFDGNGTTYVFNAASSGPNIYNYSGGGGTTTITPQCPPNMIWSPSWKTCRNIFSFYA